MKSPRPHPMSSNFPALGKVRHHSAIQGSQVRFVSEIVTRIDQRDRFGRGHGIDERHAASTLYEVKLFPCDRVYFRIEQKPDHSIRKGRRGRIR